MQIIGALLTGLYLPKTREQRVVTLISLYCSSRLCNSGGAAKFSKAEKQSWMLNIWDSTRSCVTLNTSSHPLVFPFYPQSLKVRFANVCGVRNWASNYLLSCLKARNLDNEVVAQWVLKAQWMCFLSLPTLHNIHRNPRLALLTLHLISPPPPFLAVSLKCLFLPLFHYASISFSIIGLSLFTL